MHPESPSCWARVRGGAAVLLWWARLAAEGLLVFLVDNVFPVVVFLVAAAMLLALLIFPSFAMASDGATVTVSSLWPIWGAACLQVVVAIASGTWSFNRHRLRDSEEERIKRIERSAGATTAKVDALDQRITKTREEMALRTEVMLLDEKIASTRGEMATKEDLDRMGRKIDGMARQADLQRVEARLEKTVEKIDRVIEQNGEILALLTTPASPISPRVR